MPHLPTNRVPPLLSNRASRNNPPTDAAEHGATLMQRQTIVIDRSGEILQHGTDFEAIGRNLQEFVTEPTWPWVAAAIREVIFQACNFFARYVSQSHRADSL